MTDLFERIADSKQCERRRLANLPFAKKLRLLERLRDRDAAIIDAREYSTNEGLPDRMLLLKEQRARYGDKIGKEPHDPGNGRLNDSVKK